MQEISFKEAAKLYKDITGHRIAVRTIHDEIYEKPHLGVYRFSETGQRKLCGINKHRWVYFLKYRNLACNGQNLFHDDPDPSADIIYG